MYCKSRCMNPFFCCLSLGILWCWNARFFFSQFRAFLFTSALQHKIWLISIQYILGQPCCILAIRTFGLISSLQHLHKSWSTRQQKSRYRVGHENKGEDVGGREERRVEERGGKGRRKGRWLMMMVEKMAKVVCEINRASAGRRLQGIEGV